MNTTRNPSTGSERWRLRAAKFVLTVWAVHPKGWGFLAAMDPDSDKWRQMPFRLPTSLEDLVQFFERNDREARNLYFCPNAFSRSDRRTRFALPTPYAWVDIDAGDVELFDPQPNLVWSTSPGRHQGLWIFQDRQVASTAELYSKALAYNFASDRNGWTSTKMLRIPFTYNLKPEYDSPLVSLLSADWHPQPRKRLTMGIVKHRNNELPMFQLVSPTGIDPRDVLARYRRDLHPHCRALIQARKVYEPDRSACVFEIIAGLHEAGATPPEIAAVLWVNPYFTEKYGQDEDALNAELWRVLTKLDDGR